MPGPLRHNERDAPPMCGRPAGVSRPVRQDHVTLALAGLRIGLVAMVADQSLRVGLRQPFGLLATLDPLAAVAQPRQHGRPLVDRVHCCIVRQMRNLFGLALMAAAVPLTAVWTSGARAGPAD